MREGEAEEEEDDRPRKGVLDCSRGANGGVRGSTEGYLCCMLTHEWRHWSLLREKVGRGSSGSVGRREGSGRRWGCFGRGRGRWSCVKTVGLVVMRGGGGGRGDHHRAALSEIGLALGRGGFELRRRKDALPEVGSKSKEKILRGGRRSSSKAGRILEPLKARLRANLLARRRMEG